MDRVLVYVGLLTCLMLVPSLALAQDPEAPEAAEPEGPSAFGEDKLEAKFIGLTGGIILGAELVISIQALAKVNKLWPYLVFPALGAAAGGVGGYYLEQASASGAVALMVAGIALVIPTAILTASAFAFDPEKEGAVESDMGEDGALSFELPPSESSEEAEAGGAVTEVEATPDGAPPSGSLPPPEAAPAAPAEGGAEEGGTAPTSEGGETAPTSQMRRPPSHRTYSAGITKRHQNRLAAKRRAQSGSLIFVDSDGSTGLSVPFVDVRPLQLSMKNTYADTRSGVEVYVPLVRIDLP